MGGECQENNGIALKDDLNDDVEIIAVIQWLGKDLKARKGIACSRTGVLHDLDYLEAIPTAVLQQQQGKMAERSKALSSGF